MTYLDICVVSFVLGIVASCVGRAIFVKPVFAVIENCEENLKRLCYYLMASGREFYQAWYYMSSEEVKIRQNALERISKIEHPKMSRLLMIKKERVHYDEFVTALEKAKIEEQSAKADYERFGKTV